MSKQSKAGKPAPKKLETAAQVATSIYEESLLAIRNEIRGIIAGRIVPAGHDAASRIAWLAQKASQISGEQRKAEASEAAASRRLTIPQIIAFVRQLDQSDRARVHRELQSMEARAGKGTVLG